MNAHDIMEEAARTPGPTSASETTPEYLYLAHRCAMLDAFRRLREAGEKTAGSDLCSHVSHAMLASAALLDRLDRILTLLDERLPVPQPISQFLDSAGLAGTIESREDREAA